MDSFFELFLVIFFAVINLVICFLYIAGSSKYLTCLRNFGLVALGALSAVMLYWAVILGGIVSKEILGSIGKSIVEHSRPEVLGLILFFSAPILATVCNIVLLRFFGKRRAN